MNRVAAESGGSTEASLDTDPAGFGLFLTAYIHIYLLFLFYFLSITHRIIGMDDSHWLSGIAPAQSTSKKELTDVLLHSSSNDSSLSIRIAADPSPGCGGIAWPAGQVILSFSLINLSSTTPVTHSRYQILDTLFDIFFLLTPIYSQVLANYLFNNPAIVANRSVLDLGSGTGLVGLVAAYLNARHVYLSDQASVSSFISL